MLRKLLFICTAVILVFDSIHILVTRFVSPDVWWLDLTAHFLPQQVLIALACLVALAFFKSWRHGVGAGVIALIALLATANFQFVNERPRKKASLQVISFNVWSPNQQDRDVIKWLLSSLDHENANLVFLMEVDQRWAEKLEALKAVLPHALVVPREDNFGLALLSSVPLEGVHVTSFDSYGLPALTGEVVVDGKPIHIFGVHPLPPIGSRGSQLRNRYLKSLGERVAANRGPQLVFGDLNCSPWAPCLRHWPRRI